MSPDGCDNCVKRGPWQIEHGTGREKHRHFELAECHHVPLPAWWRNAGPLWVGHGCGHGCKLWQGSERPPTPVGWSDTDWLRHLQSTITRR